MGNSCKRCFGIGRDKRKFIRAKYTMTKDFSIEFENLVEEDVPEEFVRPVTKHETQLVKQGMLYELVAEQAKSDRELAKQLAAQEEALKMEEEAYYAERRAAAALARQQRSSAASVVTAAVTARAGDPLSTAALAVPDSKGDWSDVELDDEAFDAAVACSSSNGVVGHEAKGRGLRGELRPTDSEELLRRASAAPGQPASAHNRLLQQRLNQGYFSDSEFELGLLTLVSSASESLLSDATLTEGFGDFQSVSSGREASIDLDWDHEPGMNPCLAESMARSATEEDLARLADTKRPPSAPLSPAAALSVRADSPASLVWENDPGMDFSRRHLLAEDT